MHICHLVEETAANEVKNNSEIQHYMTMHINKITANVAAMIVAVILHGPTCLKFLCVWCYWLKYSESRIRKEFALFIKMPGAK